jgi:hypothetical protein
MKNWKFIICWFLFDLYLGFPLCNSLLVEEIDVGEEKVRQVVSGLAKYYGADELLVWANH